MPAATRLLPQAGASPDAGPVTHASSAHAAQEPLWVRCGLIAVTVGFLSLVMFPIPTGFRAWIEDVIVDEVARGRGIGEALTKKALDLAEAAGARTVDLTTRPHREAAGRLYERVGFAARATRNYRYTFARSAS